MGKLPKLAFFGWKFFNDIRKRIFLLVKQSQGDLQTIFRDCVSDANGSRGNFWIVENYKSM